MVSWNEIFFFFKQKTAYEMRISDWSSDVCSSDLCRGCWRRPARRALPCASTHGSEAMADTDEQRNGVGRRQAEDAVRTLLRWAGDDPAREGLLDTPKRVADAYGDWFSGYADDPREHLERTFEEVAGYDVMIVLRDIEFESHCEHHMAPIIGKAHVGYQPDGTVVGIRQPARGGAVYARRFQVQDNDWKSGG